MEINKLSMEQRVNVGLQDLKTQIKDAAMEKKGAVAADTARGYLEAAGQFKQIGNFEGANNKLLLGFESLQNLYTTMVKNVEIPKLLRDAGKAVGSMMIAVGYVSPFTWMGACGGSSNYPGSNENVQSDGGARNDGGFHGCSNDLECSSPRVCIDGSCEYPPCVDDTNCAKGTICVNDECLPGSRRDGGSELDGGVQYDGGVSSDGGVQYDGGVVSDGGVRNDGGVRDGGAGLCSPSDTRCLNGHSLYICYDPQRPALTVECKAGWQCEDAGCRPPQEQSDPQCSAGSRSACVVTDIFDFIEEDSRHDHVGQSSCGDDKGIQLYRMNNDWVAVTMNILPPPNASYYAVDLKLSDWEAGRSYYSGDGGFSVVHPVIEILFGDDQKVDVPYSSAWDASRCTYMNNFGVFNTAGITSSNVRMNIRHGTYGHCCASSAYDPRFTMTKMRLWSCECNQ